MSSRLLGREGPSRDHTIEMVDVRRHDSVRLGHWEVPNSYGIVCVCMLGLYQGFRENCTVEMVDIRRHDSVCLGHWDVPNSYGIVFVRVGPRFEFFRLSYFTTPILL